MEKGGTDLYEFRTSARCSPAPPRTPSRAAAACARPLPEHGGHRDIAREHPRARRGRRARGATARPPVRLGLWHAPAPRRRRRRRDCRPASPAPPGARAARRRRPAAPRPRAARRKPAGGLGRQEPRHVERPRRRQETKAATSCGAAAPAPRHRGGRRAGEILAEILQPKGVGPNWNMSEFSGSPASSPRVLSSAASCTTRGSSTRGRSAACCSRYAARARARLFAISRASAGPLALALISPARARPSASRALDGPAVTGARASPTVDAPVYSHERMCDDDLSRARRRRARRAAQPAAVHRGARRRRQPSAARRARRRAASPRSRRLCAEAARARARAAAHGERGARAPVDRRRAAGRPLRLGLKASGRFVTNSMHTYTRTWTAPSDMRLQLESEKRQCRQALHHQQRFERYD